MSTWKVAAALSGLEPTAEVEIERPSWGEADAAGETCLGEMWADGKALPPGKQGWLLPRGRDSRGIVLEYRVKIQPWPKDRTNSFPVLPFCGDSYCHGFAENTLVKLRTGGRPWTATRSLAFKLPSAWRAETGWGAPSESGRVRLGRDVTREVAEFALAVDRRFTEMMGVPPGKLVCIPITGRHGLGRSVAASTGAGTFALREGFLRP